MPPTPAVSADKIIDALKDQDGLFTNGTLTSKTNKVWQLASDAINKKHGKSLSTAHLWQFVHENRHSSQNILRKGQGLPPLSVAIASDNESDEETATHNDGNERVYPKKTFVIPLSAEEWGKMKPNAKDSKKLNALWIDIFRDALWTYHHLPCPYALKARVNLDSYRAAAYVVIEGACSECAAEGQGLIIQEPEPGSDIVIEWFATNTVGLPHRTKAKLQGEKRVQAGKAMEHVAPSVYHTQCANSSMRLHGDVEPPTLPRLATLRKSKQESKDKKLNLPKGASEIETVAIMKRTIPHLGSIHDVCLDKVVVIYDTPTQMLLYKTHRAQGHTKLTGDSTGSLIERIPRCIPNAGLCAHLFLFELVLDSTEFQIPIAQMVSEKQDAASLTYWILDWMRRGGRPPNELTCDASPALLAAFARTFGKSSDLNEYINKQFLYLQGKLPKPCDTFIRKDISHIMKAVSKWKVWTDNKRVRDFYIRCFALLVLSKNLEEFKERLLHILVVSKAETIGLDEDGSPVYSEAAVQFLSEKIADPDVFKVPSVLEEVIMPDDICVDVEAPESTIKWIQSISEESEEFLQEGDKISPYFSKEVTRKFMEYSADFVLWSAVMVSSYQAADHSSLSIAGAITQRGTSASVEKDFLNLKRRILASEIRPLKLSKFVAKHLESISGQTKLAQASLRIVQEPVGTDDDMHCKEPVKATEDNAEKTVETSSKPEKKTRKRAEAEEAEEEAEANVEIDLQHTENWRGLEGKTRNSRKKPKYLTPSAETRLAVEMQKINPPKNRLLKNGSLCGHIEIDNVACIVKNTCNVDSVAHLLASAYIDAEKTRAQINGSTNVIVVMAKSLAIEGAVKDTYILRAKAIEAVYAAESLVQFQVPGTRSRKAQPGKELDCLGLVTDLVRQCFAQEPACKVFFSCTNKCKSEKEYIIIEPHQEHRQLRGYGNLTSLLNKTLGVHDKKCHCGGKLDVKCDFSSYFFVSCEYLKTPKVPIELNDLAGVVIGNPQKSFRVTGAVAYQPRHCVCYIKRVGDKWEKYDNIRNGVISVHEEQEIDPILIFYTEI